jgi:hypothetical protein
VVKLNALQITLDRFAWKGLYQFLSGAIVDVMKHEAAAVIDSSADAQQHEQHKQDNKLSPKEMAEWINRVHTNKMSDYFRWYHSSKVEINVNNTVLLIPKDNEPDDDGFYLSQVRCQDQLSLCLSGSLALCLTNVLVIQALHMMVHQVSLTNRPEWASVPFLHEGLSSLPSSEYLHSSQQPSSVANKFQV